MYWSDPKGVLKDRSPIAFDADAQLPGDAKPSGVRTDTREVWLSAEERKTMNGKPVHESIYIVVRTEGQDRVERWPRVEVGCE